MKRAKITRYGIIKGEQINIINNEKKYIKHKGFCYLVRTTANNFKTYYPKKYIK